MHNVNGASVPVQGCRGLMFLCVLDDKMNLKGIDVYRSVELINRFFCCFFFYHHC